MNWTGGRLQRHSRVYANTTLKAQKQHFAKARLRQQHGQHPPSPLRLSAFKVPLKQNHKVDHDQNRGVKRRGSTDAVASDQPCTKRRRLGYRPDTCVNHPNIGEEEQDYLRERIDIAPSTAQQDLDREHRKSAQAERNTLDAVKRSLLRRSDWMGLNAARPMHLNFPSAHELENIGRRRKMTMEDKTRQEGAQARVCRYSELDSMFRHRRPSDQTKELKVEDASIRIGSNIHHSQATPLPSQVQKPASLICQSQSSDSMLLDKEVSSNQELNRISGTSSNILPAPPKTIEVPRETRLERSLPPLDQLLDSETFDQVKARSSSTSKQNRADERQNSPDMRQRGAADGSITSETVSSSPVMGRKLLESAPLPSNMDDWQPRMDSQKAHPFSREQALQKIQKGQPGDPFPLDHEDDDDSERRNRNALHSSPRLTFRPPSSSPISKPSHFQPSVSGIQPCHPPKFTLDLQVEGKAQAAGRVDVSQVRKAQMLDIVSRHEGNDSPLRVYTRGATGHSHSKDVSVVDGDLTKCRDASTRDDARGHLEAGEPLLQLNQASQDRVQRRQPSQGHPMGRRLSRSGQLAPVSDDNRGNIEAHSDEAQAWMCFTLRDNPADVSNRIFGDPCVRAQAPRSVRRDPRFDETLPEDRQLQMTRSQYQSHLSPTQAALTNANATVHESNSNAEAYNSGNTSPLETDFLSQFSPMEGKMDDSLLNLSVYANPARTERSHITAPSQTPVICEIGAHSDSADLSPGRWSQDYNQPPRSSIYDSPAQPSCRRISRISSPSQRTPLKAITNLFVHPRRSSSRPLKKGPDHLEKSLGTRSVTTRSSQPDILGTQSTDQPPCASRTPSSARNPGNTFPLNYTPKRQNTKKRQQDDSTTHGPSSPYCTTTQFGWNQSDVVARTPHRIPRGRMSPHSLSSHKSIQYPHTGSVVGRFADAASTSNSKQENHFYQQAISAPSLGHHPSHHSHSIPPRRSPSSPEHFTFPIPPPSMARTPFGGLRAAPSSNPRPMRRPLTLRQPDAFSTPRPVRRPSPGPGEGAQPFSTPRPVRSVLGQFQRPQKPIIPGAFEDG